MNWSTREGGRQRGRDTGRGLTWRHTGAVLLAAAGLSAAVAATAAGPAAAAGQCPGSAVAFQNTCIIIGFPTPATTPATAPPTTAPPLVSLPPVTIPPPLAPRPAVTTDDAAQHLLELANTERRQAGLGELTSRADIVAIALAHSQEMARVGDLFHSTTFLSSAVKRLLNAGVGGENVAYNGDIDSAHARLMASPGHRANLMDPRFSVVGFAVVRAADGRYFITQDFIQAAGAPRVPAPARPVAPAAPRPMAAPKPTPAATAVATSPPVTKPPPALAPIVAAASAMPVVLLDAGSGAISAAPAHHAGDGINTALATTAAALLVAALCACCVVLPRHRHR